MKKIVLLLLMLSLVFAMASCTVIAKFHYCESACPVCGGCQDLDCKISTCANKCQGNHDVHEHSLTKVDGKTATCVESGLEEYFTCECGKMFADAEGKNEITDPKVIEALGHTEQIVTGKAATCTEAGLSEGKKCSVCNETLLAQEKIAALGHDIVADAAKAPTCTETGLTEGEHCTVCDYKVEQKVVAATGHSYENCACTVCQAVLPALGVTDSFDFSTQAGFDSAVASGKLGFVGNFRNNGDSFQFNADSTIQFVAPANSTITVTGHSAQYGVFNIYLNGEKADLEAANGVYKFTVTAETKVVIATGENGASYSYIKGIALEAYVDRTITEDTTINFGSEGNYKNSIVDFSGIQIGDNGGNNSQVKNGSFDLLLKAGSKVVIHGYPGYTSYQLNDGEAIESEWYTYIALTDMVLTVTPVNGNNYFYSIEITLHEGIELVAAKDSTCSVAGHEEYYTCSCHGELTEKVARELLAHTEETVVGKAATCTETGLTDGKKCSVCGEILTAQTEIPKLAHTFISGICACGHKDPNYVDYHLVGYINGADYGCEGDYQNSGIYKFVDGKLVAKFNSDSYIFIKTVNLNGESVKWYLFETYHDASKTEGILYENKSEKMFVPGKVDIEFTLTVNEDGTLKLVLEYHVHNYSEPTCTEPGKCSCGLTQGEALGHAWADATFDAPKTCSRCGISEGEALVAVATADGDKYATLAEALENGSEIVLLQNIALDAPIVLNGSYTLDLNGYTLSYESTVMGEAMITNYGTLVINDSAVNGTINYNYVGANDASYGKGNYTISNRGNLTINGGKITIANLRQHAKYPIDNNSGSSDAVLVINGGHLYNYNTSAIRMICSANYNNSVTINGGLVEGYCAIWMQNPGKNTVNGELTITGGEIRTTAAAYVNGTSALQDVSSHIYATVEGGAWSETSFVKISGGTFNENVQLLENAPATIVTGGTFNGKMEHKHNFVGATCTADGTCGCGAVGGKLGHTEQTLAGKDATCTEAGLTEGKKCATCGETLLAQKTIPANGHSKSLTYTDKSGHWYICANCDYVSDKVNHVLDETGKCECGFACTDRCDVCGKCEDIDCELCASKCDFANTNKIINFAPSYVLAAPEGPGGLAPGKDGAYIYDESITAKHVILSNGAYATIITLPNGTAAHSGVSFANNKENAASGQLGYNYGVPQIKNTPKVLRLHFTNNGDTTVSFRYDAIDYYWEKGSVELTLAAGESKTVLLVATHTDNSIGLNHQIVFPNGADAGASISVWGEFVADERMNAITIENPATQLRFGVGETFSAAGLVLKGKGTGQDRVYINGNYVTNLDGYTFTADDIGTHTVFVMFDDMAVAYQIIVDNHEHNIVFVDQQDPIPCVKDGLAAHYECTVEGCGMMFVDQYGNKVLNSIESVSCHTAPTSGVVPGTAINCVNCGTAIGIASMDNWVHFAITTSTSKIGSNIVNGKLEHGYVNGIPGTKIYIGAGTKGATNDSAFYLKMSDNDAGWQTVIPNLGTNAPAGQLRKVILFYVNYSNEAVVMNLQNDAKGGNGKVTIPANGTAICEFTIKNSGGSNWFYYYVDSNITTDVVLGVYGYFYVYNEEVDSISINKTPEKLTYKVGESFSSEGLVLNVPITSSVKKTCYVQTGFNTNYDGRIFTAEDIGTHTVTVTFGDNTATYVIDVVPEVDCANGEHNYDKISDESLFVEMQGNNAIYKKACVYCGAASEETYVAETIAFVPSATSKDNYSVEYVILDDGRIAVKLTAKTDIPAGTSSSISTNINSLPAGTNLVFPVSGNGRRVYMEMLSNADVNITWQPEFYGDRDGVTMELVAGEAQSTVWVIKYDTKAGQTKSGLPYEEFVFNSDVAAGTEIYITGLFYERGEVIDVSIKNPANKIIFKVGDSFSSAGIILSVASGEEFFDKVSITNVTTNLDGKVFTDADLGTQKVVVSWGDYTLEYDVLVIE